MLKVLWQVKPQVQRPTLIIVSRPIRVQYDLCLALICPDTNIREGLWTWGLLCQRSFNTFEASGYPIYKKMIELYAFLKIHPSYSTRICKMNSIFIHIQLYIFHFFMRVFVSKRNVFTFRKWEDIQIVIYEMVCSKCYNWLQWIIFRHSPEPEPSWFDLATEISETCRSTMSPSWLLLIPNQEVKTDFNC